MSVQRIDGFFYGLFMDQQLLRAAGTEPVDIRPAYVDGYGLRIGERATLLRTPSGRAWGMLIALTRAEFDHLYSAPGLDSYRPEALVAHTIDGEVVPAVCYNLAHAPDPHERNPEYAARLKLVLARLGFPDEYIETIG